MDSQIIIELLSAGVIAAFVTGSFSLIVAIKTNKKLEKIELIKRRYAMEEQKYEQLNSYFSELVNKNEQFEYKGEIETTMECVRTLFSLRINMFEFMKEEHEKYSFLFTDLENENIIEQEDVIDSFIHEFMAKIKEEDVTENEYVEYIGKIADSIDKFKEDYYQLLKSEMKKILYK